MVSSSCVRRRAFIACLHIGCGLLCLASAWPVEPAPQWVWRHRIESPRTPSSIARVAAAPDGSCVVVGTAYSTTLFHPGEPDEVVMAVANQSDAFLARYASDGALLWFNPIRSYEVLTNADNDQGRDVVLTPPGDLLMIGHCFPHAQFPQAGGPDVEFDGGKYLARYRLDGRLQWVRQLARNLVRLEALAPTSDGGAVVVGAYDYDAVFRGAPAGAPPAPVDIQMPKPAVNGWGFVGRYDSSGNTVWLRHIPTQGAYLEGRRPRAVDVAPDGGVLVLGRYRSPVIFPDATPELRVSDSFAYLYLVRYDATGAPTWATAIRGDAVSVRATSDGGCMIAGACSKGTLFAPGQPTEVRAPENGAFVARHRPDGSVQWIRFLPGHSDTFVGAGGLAVGSGDVAHVLVHKVAIAGATPGTQEAEQGTLLVRYDGAGNLLTLAHATTQNDLDAYDLALAPRGRYHIGGRFSSTVRLTGGAVEYAPIGQTDMLVASVTADGTAVWGRRATNRVARDRQSEGVAYANGICADRRGGAVVTGVFGGWTTLGSFADPPVILQSQGRRDVMLVRYLPDGRIAWATGFSGPTTYDQGLAVVQTPDDDFLVLTVFGDKAVHSSTRIGGYYFGRWSPEGAFRRGHLLADAQVDPVDMSSAGNGDVMVVGSFIGTASFVSSDAPDLILTSPRDAMFVARYDGEGRRLWMVTESRDKPTRAESVAALPVGGFVVGGNTYPGQPSANNPESGFVARYDSNAALQWSKTITGGVSHVSVAPAGNDGGALVAGSFVKTTVLGAGEVNATTLEGRGIFVARYGPDGSLVRARPIETTSSGRLNAALPAPDGGLDLAGTIYSGTTTFAPGEPEEVVFGYKTGFFLAHYRADLTLAWVQLEENVGVVSDFVRPHEAEYYTVGTNLVSRYIMAAGPPTPTSTPTPTATATLTPTPTATPMAPPRPEDVMVFVLDDFGAVHTGGAANGVALAGGAYFGWNIARAMQLVYGVPASHPSRLGVLALDGYGALHSYSCTRPPQNFYFLPAPGDVAADLAVFQKDLSGVPGNIGAFVLDRTGRLWAVGEAGWGVAQAASIAPPLDGVANFGVAVALSDKTGKRGWIMDNRGQVYPFGGALDPAFAVSTQDNWIALAQVDHQLVRMDASGNLQWSGTPPDGWELPLVAGDLMIDLEVEAGYGPIALDRYGALYGASAAILPPPGSGPPYFGFPAARDLELGPPFAR